MNLKEKRLISANIISATHTLHMIDELSVRHSLYNRRLKNYGNLFRKELLKVEPLFLSMADSSQSAEDRYNNLFDMVREISEIPPEYMKQFTNLIRAWKIDPEPILRAATEVMEEQLKKQEK